MAISSKACSSKLYGAGLALSLWSASVSGGEVLFTSVTHEGGSYFVEVDALLTAPKPAVRALLTDYAELGRLNPAIKESEIIATRGPGDYRVRTITKACVWFYCKNIRQVQNVIEGVDGSITATVIPEQSDFRHGYARVNIWQQPNGTRVLIRSEVAPDFWIPPLIGPWLIKRKLRAEVLETVGNIERVAEQPLLPHNGAAQHIYIN